MEGRRLAKPPRAWRIWRRPASGRLSGGRALNLLSPTAPRRTASHSRAASSVAVGSGEPVSGMAMPPMRPSTKVKSWPPSSATARRMLVASRVTSGPMPSPARTAILRRIRFVPQGLKPHAVFIPSARRPKAKALGYQPVPLMNRLHHNSVRYDCGLVRLQQSEQVLVVDGFFAVGEFGEAVVDLVELGTGKGMAKFGEALFEET